MNITCRLELEDLNIILAKRGLEARGKVQCYIDSAVLRYCDPYTPKDTGKLIQSGVIGTIVGSGKVIYNAPYARFQYYGKVMVSPSTGSPWAKAGERKVLTSRPLQYTGGAKRGSYWFERMKADHRADILREAAAIAGGRVET